MINYKINDNNKYLPVEGGTLSGDLNMGGRLIKNVASPVDGSDIVNYSTLNTKLASTDPYKVGDILYTKRTDLNNKWALCNGDYVNPNDAIAKFYPFNITDSWSSSTIPSDLCYVNGKYYYINKTGTDGSSDIYSYNDGKYVLKLMCSENLFGTFDVLATINDTQPGGYITVELFHSNDNYINILVHAYKYAKQYSGDTSTYKGVRLYRINSATGSYTKVLDELATSTNSPAYQVFSCKVGNYYITINKSGIFRGDSFYSTTTKIQNLGFNPQYNSLKITLQGILYEPNNVYIPTNIITTGNIDIIQLSSSGTVTKLCTLKSSYDYALSYRGVACILKDQNENLYFSIGVRSGSSEATAGSTSVCTYVYKYNNIDNVTLCRTDTQFLSTLNGYIPYLNGKYYGIGYKYSTGDGNSETYSIELWSSSSPTFSSVTTEKQLGSMNFPYQGDAMSKCLLMVTPSAGFYAYNSNKLTVNASKLPTITSSYNYAYIKVKE